MAATFEKEFMDNKEIENTTELTEEELNEVAGGFGLLGAAAIVGGCYVAGRIYGYYAGKKTGICG